MGLYRSVHGVSEGSCNGVLRGLSRVFEKHFIKLVQGS